MPSEHPSELSLRDFMQGRLPARECRGVVRHLLTLCPQCQGVTSKLWIGEQADPEVDWESLERSVRRLEHEAAAAPGLLAELKKHPAPRRRLLVHNLEAFQTWKLCEQVLELAFELGLENPEQAVSWARTGVDIAEALPADGYGSALVNDIRARAFTVLGNAQRINSELVASEASFRQAEKLLREGTGDPLEHGNTLHFMALLRHSQRCFSVALRLYNRAARHYRRAGDPHLVGRVLVDAAHTLSERGDLRGAIESSAEGLKRLDVERDPRFVLVAKHNLTFYLQEAGDTEEAFRLLNELLPLHAEYGRSIDRLYLRWLEGRLIRAQGRLAAAGEVFEELRQTFVERGMGYDAALVSLDLALVRLRERKTRTVARLAKEMAAAFRALGVGREASSAVMLFRKAAEQERVTIGFVRELAHYLQSARHNPRLRFEPP